MAECDSMKYKDDLPANTIGRIKKILNDLGIDTVEKWFEPVNGLFSLQIIIKGTGIKTNGKGTAPEYALASAYAEFIERLQNLALINYASPEIRDYKGFYHAPDEKRVTLEDIENASDGSLKVFLPMLLEEKGSIVSEFMRQWFDSTPFPAQKISILRKFKFYASEGDPPCFTAVPFYNVNDGNIHYVPSQLISLAYGSNGMCAGNTPEEAIIQGISEALERHVNLEIIKKNIVPPTIPSEYIEKQFPEIHNTITGIEQKGNYKLVFKDCSLEQNFPVTALIIADSKKQRYFVKFGAHPVLEIAMERCLTEMFQCRDINLNNEMPGFKYYKETGHPANIMKILRNGYGYYPAKIFSQSFSYEFTEFKDVRKLSNREQLHYLTGLLSKKGLRIFIRDVSFLGFPSYHVLIPGLSEVRGIDVKLIEHANQGKELLKIIRDLNNATEEDLESAISYLLNATSYQPTDDMARLSGLSVSNFLLVKIKKHLFISMAYCKMKRYKEARDAMDIFLSLNPGALTKPDYAFYKCARDYLDALSKGADNKEIQEVLGVFYPLNIVVTVASCLIKPENIFAKFGVLKCWNCGECSFRSSCLYEMIKNLHLKLKERYAANIVDQNKLRDLFAAD